MTAADVLLAVLALGVAFLLGRGGHPLVTVLLVVSALAVSAVLFLPTALLSEWVGMDRVHGWYGLTRHTPLDPPEWIHLIAFGWMGFLAWFARAEVRSVGGLALVTVLCISAEFAQWLADGRQPSMGDALLNVAGGAWGLATAATGSWIYRKLKEVRREAPE